MGQETTFYEEIQKCEGLDLRDNRGKRHDLALTLLCFTIALFRKRDGILSSIHRGIENKHKELCNSLSIEYEAPVSRSQLPNILAKVDGAKFAILLYKHYGLELEIKESDWFAGDGKDLRGSIQKGDKRGEAIVQIVNHKSRKAAIHDYYSGKKESEKICLQELIKIHQTARTKYTFDALHLSPATTSMIEEENGTYIIGLKNNQSILLEQMCLHSELEKASKTVASKEKSHGRIEERCYKIYNVCKIPIDKRWEKSNIQTLIRVERKFTETKTSKVISEISFYLSNGAIENSKEYFKAIREHWSCEVNNHIRDVTLQEDKLTTKFPTISRNIATFRTLIVNILLELKPKNMIALLERFQDDFAYLISFLKQINFL
jgi:predicted transposase YbfD/YdcC